jgi:hypothetical protein
MSYLKLLEKQKQVKHKSSRRQIIKLSAEINEMETKKKKKRTKNQQNKMLVL